MLVIDEKQALSLPRHFRVSQHAFIKALPTLPTKEGLENLKIAGSAQFSLKTLKAALALMSGKVAIVDLRQECHGFVNGIPISWYNPQNQSNLGVDAFDLLKQEQQLIADIKRQTVLFASQIVSKSEGNIKKTKELQILVEEARTEASLAIEQNVSYFRFGVLDHHTPDFHTIDAFINLLQTLPTQTWLYFHCRGGKGRTTSFMVMTDILRNSQKVSLEDIVQRQALLGGSDLFKISKVQDDAWKEELAVARKKFIIKFYQYANDPNGYPSKSWSQWLK